MDRLKLGNFIAFLLKSRPNLYIALGIDLAAGQNAPVGIMESIHAAVETTHIIICFSPESSTAAFLAKAESPGKQEKVFLFQLISKKTPYFLKMFDVICVDKIQ